MKFRIDIPDKEVDEFIREVMQNMPEYGESLICTSWKYEQCLYTFLDEEEGKKYKLDLPKLRKGFEKMVQDLYDGKLPGIKQYMPDVMDGGQWDAVAVDALVQYSIFGELLYS